MRGLAEFVMKGRKQAIMAVLLLGLIPLLNLLSPVLVGLVVLRKGFQEAVQVLVWAILPIGGWALAGDPVPLIMLLGITGLAGLLRSSESWEFTLLAAIAVGVCVEIYLRLQPAVLDLIFLQMQPYFEANAIQGEQLDALRDVMTSFMGAVYMFLSIILLMLARWMQAALFNPGGFQKEFHGLRVEQNVALILVSCMMLANFEILIPQTWMLYLVLPLMFSGIALMHAVVATKKLSSLWLAVLYALIVLPLIANLVVLLALLDSWYDFRTRLTKSA
ncbi:MAG: hypothetical protein HN872_09095 [Gammaproteobacteria bacterium]|jgi:hypothetical protein|nr:hypothetical protein [Gammaproteobacteria bacterium]